MAVTKGQKLYCANNLVAMVIQNLLDDAPDVPQEEMFKQFGSSQTYRQLYDFKTELWKEGPDYLIWLFQQERNNS